MPRTTIIHRMDFKQSFNPQQKTKVSCLSNLVRAQVILYSGESLMSRRPLLRWLVYNLREVFEKSSDFSFSQASKVAQ